MRSGTIREEILEEAPTVNWSRSINDCLLPERISEFGTELVTGIGERWKQLVVVDRSMSMDLEI